MDDSANDEAFPYGNDELRLNRMEEYIKSYINAMRNTVLHITGIPAESCQPSGCA